MRRPCAECPLLRDPRTECFALSEGQLSHSFCKHQKTPLPHLVLTENLLSHVVHLCLALLPVLGGLSEVSGRLLQPCRSTLVMSEVCPSRHCPQTWGRASLVRLLGPTSSSSERTRSGRVPAPPGQSTRERPLRRARPVDSSLLPGPLRGPAVLPESPPATEGVFMT